VAAAVGQGAAPWRKGRTIFLTGREDEGGSPRLVVRRWDGRTGEPLPERVLAPPGLLVELVAEDGRHLNASYRPPGGRPLLDEYLWSIYDLGTGALVGRIPERVSAAPFCVLGRRLVHVAAPSRALEGGRWLARPRELVARALPDGAVAWRLAIRDTRDTTQGPPSRR
jgi:hypothetical protein